MLRINDVASLHFFLNELGVGVIVIGRDEGTIVYANRRACKDLGKNIGDIAQRHYREVFWPEFVPVYDQLFANCEEDREHTTTYYWPDMLMWEQIKARVVDWNGTPCILISVTNISEVTRSEYKSQSLAYFDNVLKLPNGKKLEEDVNELANLETVALICMGIGQLNDINELYGWENGDNLLKQIRDWLLSSETRRAQLYRVNDGFVILGRKVEIEDAKARADEIIRRFTRPWFISAGGNGIMLYCRARLGIVYGKYIRDEMRSLMRRTLCSSDCNVSGCYAIYDEEADQQAKYSVMLRDTLINCIFNDMKGFEVHYQPIVDAKTAEWVALEAVCRWTTPTGERVSPGVFIDMSEQLGLIDNLDSWVRKTAMTQCVALGLDKKNFCLNVNFSPMQKISDALVENLLSALERIAFPAHKLALEITESAKMLFNKKNLSCLKRLQGQGVRLSLDDFGTGYSSFANLITIRANALKTDKLFLERIEEDAYRQYLLRTLVDIAHYLNMHITTEGVRSNEQYQLLQEYGVDYAQGYLFSNTLTFEELARSTWRFH